LIEKAEADKRDVLIACHTESKEQVKKTIVECDAKVSRLHVRKMPNITDSFSVNFTNKLYKHYTYRFLRNVIYFVDVFL